MPALQAQGSRGLELGAAAAAGLAAQAVQVVCLREVLQVARGGEAVLGIALAAWLIGSGVGAASWRSGRLLAAAMTTILPLGLVPLLRWMPVGHGAWAPAAALLAGIAAYGPGAYFATVLARIPANRALMWEAVGACVAGAALTFLLLERVDAFSLLLVSGALCLLFANRWLAIVPLVALFFSGAADRATFTLDSDDLWKDSAVVRTAETPYGRLLWLRRGGQESLFSNGQLVLTLPDEVGAEAFANVVLAAHPNPRRVLVLGLGGLSILRQCLRHPVERLELAVQDRASLELTRAELPEGVRVRFGDLRRIAAAEPRDVVLLMTPAPLTLSTNRTCTSEFFDSVKLEPGGLLAFGLPAAPNEREGHVMARNVSVFRALPFDVRVLPGPVDLFLAGVRAPDVSPETLSARLSRRGIVLEHHAQDFFAEDYRIEEVARVTRAYLDYPEPAPPAVPFEVETSRAEGSAPETLANQDLHPGAVLHAAAALARREKSTLLGAATRYARHAPLILVLPCVLGLIVALRRRRAARLTAATTGAASMGLWVVLLMVYQARVGALYGDLALLAAAFMAGFAIGARVRLRVVAADALFMLVCLAVASLLPLGGKLELLVLVVMVGAAGGAVLANVALTYREAAARLYAADLLGAALAALLYGTFLVPTLGAMLACATAAALKLFSLCANLLTAEG